MKFCAIAASTIVLAFFAFTAPANSDGIFIIRSTPKPTDAVVAAIKSYSELKKWQYLSENTVKQGEVRLVKLCIPEVGQLLWSAGLKLSALLPCGNVGVYRKGAATEVSVLHPRYMHVLHPDPATQRAGAVAEPLLIEMLDVVTK
jgi:hypothetical protein